MPPINQLRIGQIIVPRIPINRTMAANWRYAKECSDIVTGLPVGAELKVVEINISVPGKYWIRVEIGGSWGTKFLKLSGEEVALQFQPKG